jgi:hypothetical protein
MKSGFTQNLQNTQIFCTFRHCSCNISWRRASVASSGVVVIDMIFRWNRLLTSFFEDSNIMHTCKTAMNTGSCSQQSWVCISQSKRTVDTYRSGQEYILFFSNRLQNRKSNLVFFWSVWMAHDIFWLIVIVRHCWEKIVEWKIWDACWHFQNVTHR